MKPTARRKFLEHCGAALGSCFLPLIGRAQKSQPAAEIKPDDPATTLIADLEKLIPRLMQEAVLPGLSIAVIHNGRLLWRRGFGFKDSASKEPVNHDTVFEAASVSKTIFASAVLQLCDKKVIQLDTPLTRYTPWRILEGDPRLELITARHVLSHTCGFQDWRSTEAPLKIHFEPGMQFLYSGEGYYYLQSVVTQLTGSVEPKNCARYEADLEVCATDIDPFLKRTLLVPLGMASSGYVWNDTFEQHSARPHDGHGKPLTKKKPTATDAARYASAGGLHTTPTDYAKFLIQIVNPSPSEATRLTHATLKEMLRPHIRLPEDQKIDGANSWALGWAIQERATGNVIVHSGGQEGFRSLAMASLEKKSGFIILTNGDSGGKVIYDQKLGDVLNRLFAG